jgi:glycosyltransferase 2 family protein
MPNSQVLRPPVTAVPPTRKGLGTKAWWPWLKRLLTLTFFALVAWLLVSQAQAIDWQQVLAALRNYPLTALTGAIGLMLASFTLYSCFDLIGRRYTGHTLATPTVMLVTAISYAFNLNLGSWVGGIAFRYRLYSRLGLRTGTITRVMSLSMLANWMGYILLAGAVFTFMPPTLPDTWDIGSGDLRWIGLVLLVIAAGYLGLCAFSPKRVFFVRGHEIDLPSFPLALLQLCMGAANWLVMSGIIFILLQHRIEFPAIVSVLLLAAIAGVITHIPGNLGVLEAVFVALLSDLMPKPELLAGLVAYRVLYYLLPLAAATLGFVTLEWQSRRRQQALRRQIRSATAK